MLCDYGCGKEAKYKFKNGKLCCEINWKRCVAIKPKISGKNSCRYGKKHTKETLIKMRNKVISEETRRKIGEKSKGRKQPDKCKKNQSKRMKEWLSKHANSFPVKGYKNNREWMLNEGADYLNSISRNPEKMKIDRERRRQKFLNGYSLYLNKCIKNPSKAEVKLRSMVQELYPSCKFQYGVFNYSLDIAIPEYKIAIEYDGWYHFDCQEHIDYHKKRRNKIENEGWKFIKYTIYDKFPSIEQLKEDIIKIMKE